MARVFVELNNGRIKEVRNRFHARAETSWHKAARGAIMRRKRRYDSQHWKHVLVIRARRLFRNAISHDDPEMLTDFRDTHRRW